jgi:pimeloyl-ACP methyl ester carboxylesterase
LEDAMKTITGSTGTTVSYTVDGSGPPLVLVHGGFSDHATNWTFVTPLFRDRFTVYAIARRGRGATDATVGHRLEDEARDVVDLVRSIGTPVHLLGHSYGGPLRGAGGGAGAGAGHAARALRTGLA